MEHIVDIKSKAFAVKIIKFTRFLQEEKHEFVLSKQILRSGTSIGANTRERKNAQSKADFVNKLTIALKEADETQYWLELLYESQIIKQNLFDSLNKELKEIIAIITSSIKTAKNKHSHQKNNHLSVFTFNLSVRSSVLMSKNRTSVLAQVFSFHLSLFTFHLY